MNAHTVFKTPKEKVNSMAMKILGLLMVACGLLFEGCISDNAEPKKTTGTNETPVDSTASGSLIFAFQLNRDASNHRRLARSSSESETEMPSAQVPAMAVGWSPSESAPGSEPARGYSMQNALLKTSAAYSSPLAQASLHAPFTPVVFSKDTNWIQFDDSLKGYVQQLRTYNFTDSFGTGSGRDSLVYKWPYTAPNQSVLAHISVRTYSSGKKVTAKVRDEDGDGILNQCPASKLIKIRKEWTTILGDTLLKTFTHTTHGQTSVYDSVGIGSPTSWTDSVSVLGKPVWWQETLDGDGDGFVLTHATGSKTKVIRNSYRDTQKGSLQINYEVFGPGADENYLTQADNELFPYRTVVVNDKGIDQATIKYGDVDGDGLFWNPAIGAANKAWVTHVWAVSDSITKHTDSLVEVATASGKLKEARMVLFVATLKYADGSVSAVSSKFSQGSTSLSDSFTVLEHRSFAAYIPKGSSDPMANVDSTLRVSWILSGDPTTATDDKVTHWFSQTFYKPGRPLVSTVDVFTPNGPLALGQTALAGTSMHQEIMKPTTSQSVIRTLLTRSMDPAKNVASWKSIRYFENGDSAVTTGSNPAKGIAAYTSNLGPNVKNSGWSDAASGTFKDTLKFMDPNGQVLFSEYCSGTLMQATGVGEFDRTSVRQGISTQAHFKIIQNGSKELLMTKTIGTQTSVIRIVGDTATQSDSSGLFKRNCTWYTDGSGVYRVRQSVDKIADGSKVSTGLFAFGEEGSGKGTYTAMVKGLTQSDKKVLWNADGAVFLDGIRFDR